MVRQPDPITVHTTYEANQQYSEILYLPTRKLKRRW